MESGKKSIITTIPKQINLKTSEPKEQDTITTLIKLKDTMSTMTEKTFIDLIVPGQNNILTNIPKLKDSLANLSNQNDDFTTSLMTNDLVSIISEQKDTSEIEITIPRSSNSTSKSIISTIVKNNSIVTQDNIGNTILILLGFSNMIINKFNLIISFYIYFIPVKNYLHSQKMRLHINIQYNSLLRLLQNKEAICQMENIHQSNQYKYLCIAYAETKNIKNIEVIPEFIFESDTNVEIVGITPLSKMFMDNLQNIDNKDLFKSEIYKLDHSKYNKNEGNKFNISGIIQEPKPNFINNTNLSLMINHESSEKKTEEINCSIIDIIDNNYILNCKLNKVLNGDLQAAISYIGKDLLVINFETGFDSIIKYDSKKLNNNNIFFSKKYGKIKTVSIALIIILIIIAVASAIIIIIINKRRKNKFSHIKDSSREIINKFEG